MSDRLYDAFEVCLAALQTGVDLETCLELYPDLAAELRPALEAALAARSMAHDGLPAGARQRSRARVLGVANAMRRRRLLLPLRGFPRLALAGLAAVLAAFLGVGGLVAASAQSLPGDALYPIKRAGESLSLELSGNAARQSLQVDYSLRRSHEVRSLLDMSRSAPVSFQGVVRRQTADSWLVGNIPVSLPKDTVIIGNIKDGVTVEVEGETQAGGVLARQVRLKAYELDGPVQAISGTRWTVGGIQLVADGGTIISPGLGVGDSVIVLLEIDEHDLSHARAILRRQTPAPSLQPAPSMIPTTVPTPVETEPAGGGSNQTTEFNGILQSIAGSTWTVGGRDVHVGPRTEIDGSPRIGDTLKVNVGVAPDGSLAAFKIEVITGGAGGGGTPNATATPTKAPGGDGGGDGLHNVPVTLTGMVTAISGSSWTVGGQVILVNAATEIKDNPQIGDTVKVTALSQPGGSMLASKIEKE